MNKYYKLNLNIDEEDYKELLEYATNEKLDVSSLLDEAVRDFLIKKRQGASFKEAADQTFNEFDKALKKLAK